MADPEFDKPPAPLLFTSHSGEIFELKPDELPSTSSLYASSVPSEMEDITGVTEKMDSLRVSVVGDLHNLESLMTSTSLDGNISPPNTHIDNKVSNVTLPSPLGTINESTEDVVLEVPPLKTVLTPPTPFVASEGKITSDITDPSITKAWMIYNVHGDLVSAEDVLVPPKSRDLDVTQTLRLIKIAFHHDFRHRLGDFIISHFGGKPSVVDEGATYSHLLSWELEASTPGSTSGAILDPSLTSSSEISESNAHFQVAPRLLEIGCSEGGWCFEMKNKHPDWIIEGVDDADRWSRLNLDLKDFMADPAKVKIAAEYYKQIKLMPKKPEFTLRNLNCLLTGHPVPFPRNLYGLIRGRDIFDRIESYKLFLDDLRTILQPGGVVEFLEIDPRPRSFAFTAVIEQSLKSNKTSYGVTDFTGTIADRFKDPLDDQLATTIPGWAGRVEARLKARLRPRDDIAAVSLKSWLQGAGFSDVRQTVHPLRVGGETAPGKLLKDFCIYQAGLEDEIPKLKEALPVIEVADIESGAFYLNLHIVTGRKPSNFRTGDLLPDGTRQAMTGSKHNTEEATTGELKNNKWIRYLQYEREAIRDPIIGRLDKFIASES